MRLDDELERVARPGQDIARLPAILTVDQIERVQLLEDRLGTRIARSPSKGSRAERQLPDPIRLIGVMWGRSPRSGAWVRRA